MEQKKYENIIYEKKNRVATITLNRPKTLNALSIALMAEMRDALRDARADIGIIKTLMNKGAEMDLDHALYYEAECLGSVLATEDSREGLKAFLEKRKAEFKGK